jgi:SAM domain (Sterile alpha motif)
MQALTQRTVAFHVDTPTGLNHHLPHEGAPSWTSVGWLRSLGLEQYEAAFRDNAIDDDVLPDLTDQDLEKLGVLLGHRRKLLRAIANLAEVAAALETFLSSLAIRT